MTEYEVRNFLAYLTAANHILEMALEFTKPPQEYEYYCGAGDEDVMDRLQKIQESISDLHNYVGMDYL